MGFNSLIERDADTNILYKQLTLLMTFVNVSNASLYLCNFVSL